MDPNVIVWASIWLSGKLRQPERYVWRVLSTGFWQSLRGSIAIRYVDLEEGVEHKMEV